MPMLLSRFRNWVKTRGKTVTGKAMYRNVKTGTVRTNKGTPVVVPKHNIYAHVPNHLRKAVGL